MKKEWRKTNLSQKRRRKRRRNDSERERQRERVEEDKEMRDCRKIEKERNGIELNDSVRRTLWRFFI
jgi:hypothetical protein